MPEQTERVRDVRAAYDAVAGRYAEQLSDELDGKPLDRALLAALLELAGDGTVADLGCGPGHVTRYLARTHAAVIGVDLSPAMIDLARSAAPELDFQVASMLDLPLRDGSLAGVVALYSVIHFEADERRAAFREIARVLRPGGHLLVSAHVADADSRPGDVHRTDELLGHAVRLDHHFLAADTLADELGDAGLTVTARLERAPIPDAEYPSTRSYLIARR